MKSTSDISPSELNIGVIKINKAEEEAVTAHPWWQGTSQFYPLPRIVITKVPRGIITSCFSQTEMRVLNWTSLEILIECNHIYNLWNLAKMLSSINSIANELSWEDNVKILDLNISWVSHGLADFCYDWMEYHICPSWILPKVILSWKNWISLLFTTLLGH